MEVDWARPIQSRVGEPVRDPIFFDTPRGILKVSIVSGPVKDQIEYCVNTNGRWFDNDDDHPNDIINEGSAEPAIAWRGNRLRRWAYTAVALTLAASIGYGAGAYRWRGMAVLESYAIGFDHGYSTGISDATTPDAEVVQFGPDGKIINKQLNRK